MRDDGVTKKEACDPNPEKTRQWYHFKISSEWRVRQDSSDNHDEERHGQQERAGDALEERNLRGADNMNDKRLC